MSEQHSMDSRVKAVIGAMSKLMGSRLSVRGLSGTVNLTPGRLRELFKKETGRSPLDYLKDLRMQRAAELLPGTFLSIKEVTFLIGVRDVSHFVRDFKKLHGITPSEFRGRERHQILGA